MIVRDILVIICELHYSIDFIVYIHYYFIYIYSFYAPSSMQSISPFYGWTINYYDYLPIYSVLKKVYLAFDV